MYFQLKLYFFCRQQLTTKIEKVGTHEIAPPQRKMTGRARARPSVYALRTLTYHSRLRCTNLRVGEGAIMNGSARAVFACARASEAFWGSGVVRETNSSYRSKVAVQDV